MNQTGSWTAAVCPGHQQWDQHERCQILRKPGAGQQRHDHERRCTGNCGQPDDEAAMILPPCARAEPVVPCASHAPDTRGDISTSGIESPCK